MKKVSEGWTILGIVLFLVVLLSAFMYGVARISCVESVITDSSPTCGLMSRMVVENGQRVCHCP